MDSLADIQEQCSSDSARWFSQYGNEMYRSLPMQTLALCGEAGELANVVKKIVRGDFTLEDEEVQQAVAHEIVDVLIYTVNCANLLGISLSAAYSAKREFNEQRYTNVTGIRPIGYSRSGDAGPVE